MIDDRYSWDLSLRILSPVLSLLAEIPFDESLYKLYKLSICLGLVVLINISLILVSKIAVCANVPSPVLSYPNLSETTWSIG